ncbi:MAG: Sel1 domain repeat-containing protein [Deltaproteobacteria bacterium]|nr:Sel1 domain repeat-containing protein [Deltaproteobacteria bacterium]
MSLVLVLVSALWGCGRTSDTAKVEATKPEPPAVVTPCTYEEGREACTLKCDRGSNESCAVLGLMYLRGDVMKTDYPKAKALLERACAADVAVGCGGLGSLYGAVEKDFARARPMFEKGCSRGDPLSCESLGGIEAGADGHKVDDHLAASRRANVYYRRACELGSGPGCAFAAVMIADKTVEGQMSESLDLYMKACGRGVGMACRHGAKFLNKDTPEWKQVAATVDSTQLTADLLERGCKAGDVESCKLQAPRGQ